MSRRDKSETEIASLRGRIDDLDTELLALLNRRAEVVRQVGELKGGTRVYRPEREAEILRRVASSAGGSLPAGAAAAVFREVIGSGWYHVRLVARRQGEQQ